MKLKRAIVLGIAIWIIGILFYTISQYVPVLENPEKQANIVLFVVVIPLVWFACSLYYKKDNTTNGLKIGSFFLIIAIILDAIFTVPLFVIPFGGTYSSFFISLSFWTIALEFILVAFLYKHTQINS